MDNITNYQDIETIKGILKSYINLIDNGRNVQNDLTFKYPDVLLSDLYSSLNFVIDKIEKRG